MKKQGRKLPMRKLRETARLFLELKLGVRPIARACNISPSTAHTYMEKLRKLGTGYGEIMAMDDDSLSNLLFPGGNRLYQSYCLILPI